MKLLTEIPDNFRIEEFVHPEIIRIRGLEAAIEHVTPFQLTYAHLLRTKSGVPITLNNWIFGGDYVSRGTRPPWIKPRGGGSLSQHYKALALDASSNQLNTKGFYEVIMDNFDEFYKIGLTAIEDIKVTKTWLHGDGRLLRAEELWQIERDKQFKIVKPKN